jgi:virginiamycin B lyase
MTVSITAGPDGNLWFSYFVDGQGHGNLATITPTGTITQYPAADYPDSLTFTPDGNLWFVNTIDQIGRKAPDGTLTYFTLPTKNSSPNSVVLGPDGNMWFTESGGDMIGRLHLP